MLVTVFTPVYNRERSIRDVYESLCAQTCKDFEWLVINDGSSDGTDAILDDVVKRHDNSFPIHYVKKENEGLNRTINRGLDLAQGTLFMRLDSDDTALPDAVENIVANYGKIADRPDLCAIAFYPLDAKGNRVGMHPFDNDFITDFTAYRDKYGATGDRSEVMKVDVFRKFKFPEYPGEKFCAEGLVWNRIARKYNCLYINKPLYQKGDADDTITADVYNHLKRNCQATTQYYLEIMTDERCSFKYRWINAVKYYRYAFFAKRPIFKGIPLSLALFGLPVGLLVVVYDKIKHG